MTETDRTDGSTEPQQPTAAELEERLAETRADLGDTVEALSGKLDVGSRVRTRVGTSRDNAAAHARSARDTVVDATTTAEGGPRPEALAAAGAVVVVAVLVVVLARRRRA